MWWQTSPENNISAHLIWCKYHPITPVGKFTNKHSCVLKSQRFGSPCHWPPRTVQTGCEYFSSWEPKNFGMEKMFHVFISSLFKQAFKTWGIHWNPSSQLCCLVLNSSTCTDSKYFFTETSSRWKLKFVTAANGATALSCQNINFLLQAISKV
jgi:hypothetical protein